MQDFVMTSSEALGNGKKYICNMMHFIVGVHKVLAQAVKYSGATWECAM